MMLDKKKIRVIFFFNLHSKWVLKQQRQLTTSTTHLAQELLTVQCSGGSRSFAKETRALKMRSVMPGHQKLTRTSCEQSSKLILLQLYKKFPKNSTLTNLQSFGIWSKVERWKSLISGCLISWPKTKKKQKQKHHFEVSSSLILCNNNEPILDWTVMCDKKWILHTNWQWLVQWLGPEEA